MQDDPTTPEDEKPEEPTAPAEDVTEPEQPTSENSDDETENDDDYEEVEDKGPGRLQKLKVWYVSHKKKTIPATVLLVLVLLFGIPLTRYTLLGLVLKKTYVVAVTDTKSHLPVSEVELQYRGKTVKTDANGKAIFTKVAVGKAELKATKKYYKDTTLPMLVPLDPKNDFQVALEPTGRQVPFKAVNKLTGKPLAGVTLSAADTQAKTDENGEATIVLPPTSEKVEATVSADGYNQQKVTVVVSPLAVKTNTFQLVSTGKVYYLSKRTGVINVMKADLDGANAQVVLAGTGKESEDDTILLASRDWQYLGLKSRRDSASAKIYLIDTATDKLTEVDSGDAQLSLVGWSGHRLVYQVQRNNVKVWENRRNALKSYDAEKKQLTLLEESVGEGTSDSDYASTELQSVSILSDRITYDLIWYAGYSGGMRLQDKKHSIVSIQPDKSNRQVLKDFDAKQVSYIQTVQSEVGEIYYRAYGATPELYTYENGKVTADSALTNETFNRSYPTFLISPTGESTFWSESRDGKNTLFVGDASAKNGKEIATLSEYAPYGWYSDNYVLVSKGGSELFIMPSNGIGASGKVVKITDYHKPATSFFGYGYGYGGL